MPKIPVILTVGFDRLAPGCGFSPLVAVHASAAGPDGSWAPPALHNILRMSAKLRCLAAALCLYALAAYIYFPVVDGHPYAYDEADYMWAGKQGLWANYTDQHGLSFFEFVRKGLELSRDPGKRTSFSQFIRSSGDIGMYRHYHGPMYALWLAVLHKAGVVRENVFRGSGLLIHFGTATAILLGFWAAFPSLPLFAGLVACALYVFNRTGLSAATEITQHGVFAFLCVATLFAASRFFRNLEPRWFYAMMALLPFASAPWRRARWWLPPLLSHF